MFQTYILLVLSLLCFQTPAMAADSRMAIDLIAETEEVDLDVLHSNVSKAAALALPVLWRRVIPLSAQASIPKRVKAVRFLEKEIPTESGVQVIFHSQRVMAFLKKHHIAYIAQQPAFNLMLQAYGVAGNPMQETANALLDAATQAAEANGYRIDDQGAALVILWRWLDNKQVSVTVRGNSKAGEFFATRRLHSADPVAQLTPWMMDVLLKARDAYAEQPSSSLITQSNTHLDPLLGLAAPIEKPEIELRLQVQRASGLADQVLFEQELRQDPRIVSLSLRQVNKDGQQYRLQLKDSDDLWLAEWFSRRGMTLTPTIEGWIAR